MLAWLKSSRPFRRCPLSRKLGRLDRLSREARGESCRSGYRCGYHRFRIRVPALGTNLSSQFGRLVEIKQEQLIRESLRFQRPTGVGGEPVRVGNADLTTECQQLSKLERKRVVIEEAGTRLEIMGPEHNAAQHA